ncbi:L-lactate dehydrogenase [Ligilactobacillus apodemi]|uniref:L-lactate dehydrogenase n=1 Tax=Ligilactobacillus apodemi TaxID=307126 RepID=UPI00214B3B4D|nr:L-lactate dehydrogenase [Ligilactobacillus apodemi]MCR1901314.1 L-lactate dehydrogenase [Ligilactobacillus apodemi]
MRKLGVIGIGNVGVTVAYTIVSQGIADELVMIDTNEKKVLAEKLDFEDAMPRMPYHTEIKIQDYAALKDADVVITAFGDITASVRTGNRFAELEINSKNAAEVGQKLKEAGFKGVLINISNPCDAITTMLQKATGLPKNRVFGTGTFLDTARMQHVVGDYLKQDSRNIDGYVLGEHGNSQFNAWSTVRANNKPITEILTAAEIAELDSKPSEGAWTVASGKGYTSYAIATCGVRLAQAVMSNAKLFAPASVYVDSVGTYIGYPAIIGANGVEDVVELQLSPEELTKLNESANYIKDHVAQLEK